MKLNLNTYIIPCYGITKDPKTDDFMIVMKYASDGSLRQYLNKNLKNLKWGPKLNIIRTAAEGLYNIHKSNLTHKNLHSGNIKKFPELWKQIEMIEKSKDTDDFSNENDKVKRTSYITHHQATYTSCALSFANLSQP
ncbi:10535_t:CDS:2, partial [Gigaspora rosea]